MAAVAAAAATSALLFFLLLLLFVCANASLLFWFECFVVVVVEAKRVLSISRVCGWRFAVVVWCFLEPAAIEPEDVDDIEFIFCPPPPPPLLAIRRCTGSYPSVASPTVTSKYRFIHCKNSKLSNGLALHNFSTSIFFAIFSLSNTVCNTL